MEKDLVTVNGANLGDRNGVEEGVLESRTAEMHVMLSNELNESEEDDDGDEVYVEAVAGDTPRSDHGESVISKDGNAEKIESWDGGNEVDKFEEAIEEISDDAIVNGKEIGSVREDKSTSDQNVDSRRDEGNVILETDEKQFTDATGVVENLEEGTEINGLGQEHKKLENGVLEQEGGDAVANFVTAQLRVQGHEPLGSESANEVKGGDRGSNLEVGCIGNDFHRVEVNEADDAISERHKNEKLKELGNVSSSLDGQHLDSLTESDFNLKHTFSPSMAAENEAIQANSASHADYHATIPRHEINVNFPLLEKAEAAEGVKLLPLVISTWKVGAGSVGLIVESSRGSETLREASIDESVGAGKEMDNKDVVDENSRATSQSIVDLSAVTSSDSKAVLTDANGQTSEPLVKELHAVSCHLYSEAKSKDDKFMEVNGAVPQDTEHDVRPATSASSTTGIGEIPTHSAMETRDQESIPGNKQDQASPATDVLPSSNRLATSAPVPPRPAGLGRAAPLPEPASRHVQQPRVNGTLSQLQNQLADDPTNGEGEETDETREKLQMIRVKFLRLANRLGQTPHNVVVAQVLYRLGLAEQLRGRSGGRVAGFSFDRASSMAEQLEASGQEPLDFSCTIMVLGKTGVGKSATINSIFDEVKFGTDAFQSGTKKVQDVVGTVQGIKVRVIDTPGLLPSWSDQLKNEKILLSVQQYIKRTPPDIILYLDRLDVPNREFGDMPLLRTITQVFGPSIWFNAIVVLTHAASAPPEGPNGTTSYDMFVTQRSHVVQQTIRLAAGDMRLMNPVSLVENHSACRTNRAGQRVLPNGQVWKPHLLLLSFASKILAEANTLLKLQDSPPGKPFAARSRAPSLPFLLSSLLQSRPPVKLPVEQYTGDDDALDDDLEDSSDSEDESEYDGLPPFKRLTKAQLAKLPKAQRKAYYDELEYRERLFMKQQLKEERKRRKMMKKMQTAANDLQTEYRENVEEESTGAASVPVPLPDAAIPASFDSDNPTHRYRCLDSSNQWLVRPVLDPNSWDHDVGYEGINVERLFTFKEKIPISFSGQFSKDKKDIHLQMEMASTIKHGEGRSTSVGFDLQSMGRDIAYTLHSEARFINWRKNKALTGFSITLLGDTFTGGLKVEDKLILNKQAQLVVSAGAVVGRGDVAYGGSLEATLRDKDHPLGCFLSSLGLSVMDWHGDLAIGSNLQSQIPIGRSSNLIGRVSVNNRGSGQVSIRFNSSEHLQIFLVGVVPLVKKLLSNFQPVQLGG